MRSRREFLAAAAAFAFSPRAHGQDKPKRDVIVRSARPEDFETPLNAFDSWLTPNDRFFVRSHHYTPKVDARSWKLSIAGVVDKPLTFTLDDLKKLPRAEVVAVLECAGNGRSFYDPPLIGIQWAHGAVGNARWSGVRLGDLLRQAGVKSAAKEVLFDGADVPVGTMPEFQRTIPISKALDNDTLLAWEMNGEQLPVSHGFPLRLVAPGWAGDSWTKWVTRIDVLDREFDGFFMKTAYRHPGRPVAPGAAVDPAQMEPVTSLRVKSLIAGPVEGVRVPAGKVRVHGTAWSGVKPISGVEVSVDSGRTWRPARLGKDQARYAWRQWDFEWTPPSPGYYTVMSRAVDGSGDRQPLAQEWNPSGYLWNVVQRTGVEVLPAGAQAAAPAVTKPSRVEVNAKFRSACLTCHEMDVIEQQRLTRGQWEREVDKMIRWGAPGADRAELIEFLVRSYGLR